MELMKFHQWGCDIFEKKKKSFPISPPQIASGAGCDRVPDCTCDLGIYLSLVSSFSFYLGSRNKSPRNGVHKLRRWMPSIVKWQAPISHSWTHYEPTSRHKALAVTFSDLGLKFAKYSRTWLLMLASKCLEFLISQNTLMKLRNVMLFSNDSWWLIQSALVPGLTETLKELMNVMLFLNSIKVPWFLVPHNTLMKLINVMMFSNGFSCLHQSCLWFQVAQNTLMKLMNAKLFSCVIQKIDREKMSNVAFPEFKVSTSSTCRLQM